MLPTYDSHAHFSGADWAAVLSRAEAAGMDGLLAVGCSDENNASALAVAGANPKFAAMALGFDYTQAGIMTPDEAVGKLSAWLEMGRRGETPPLACVGEIGVDRHYSPENVNAQLDLFDAQLAFAVRNNLPVSVHSREAEPEVVSALKFHSGTSGSLHCFTGGLDFARKVLDAGLHVGFSGIVTFRNADALRSIVKSVPLDRMLVETDSPYLAPVPMRGSINEPQFVRYTVEAIATLIGKDADEVAAVTTHNARALFCRCQ